MEGTPSDLSLAALRESIGGVAGVHDLRLWSGVNAMSMHVILAG